MIQKFLSIIKMKLLNFLYKRKTYPRENKISNMEKPNYGLLDSFELKGKWFLPTSKDTTVNGVLRYFKGKIILETMGSIKDGSTDMISAIKQGNDSSDVIESILGFSTSGELVTLTNCYVSNISSGTGLSVYHYGGSQLYIGEHYETKDKIKFNHIELEYSNLNLWYPPTGIKVNVDELITKNTVKVEHKTLETVSIDFDENFKIELQKKPSFNKDHNHDKFTIEETTTLTISNSELSTFSAFSNVHLCCKHFLMLGMLNSVHPLKVIGWTGTGGKTVNIFPSWRLYEKTPKIEPHKMLFLFSDIKDDFAVIFQRWVKFWLEFRDIITIYYSTVLDQSFTTTEIQFQRIVQVLEGYHRQKYPSDMKMAEEEYEKMIEDMKSKLKDNKKEIEFVETLKIMGNSPNLEHRLSELVKKCPLVFVDVKTEKPIFTQKIVKTRNYFAHSIEELKVKAVTDARELFYLKNEMMILVESLFISELALSESISNRLIEKTREIRNYAKNHPMS